MVRPFARFGCALLATGALAGAAPAAADPDTEVTETPTAEPAPPADSGIGTALGQSGAAPAGPLGLPDLSAYTGNLMLGQNPVPSAPGAAAAAVIPDLNVFSPGYLLQQNTAPAPPGEGTPVPGLGPNQDIPGTGRVSFLHRIYEMYQAGGLRGALLGQQSGEEFAQQAADAAAASQAG